MGRIHKVLVVDNSEAVHRFLGARLKNEGYIVSKAYDGLEALEKIAREPPDLLILDLIMPQIEGDRLCRYLKEDPRYSHIPIIIMSGIASESEESLKTLGADAYIVKDRPESILKNLLATLQRFEETEKGGIQKPPIFGMEKVTARQLVKELLATKRHHESILQNMAEGVIKTDHQGRISFMNKEAVRILGISEGKVMGKDMVDLFKDSDRNDIEKGVRRLSDGVPSRELLTCRYGEKVLKINFSNIPEGRKIVGLLAIIEDVTERERLKRELEQKIEETNRAQRQLVQSEKLAATSKLAAGIAHEIKNPLNSLSFASANLTEVIHTGKGTDDIRRASREHLALIQSDIERIRDMVDKFMSFARPREVRLVERDVNEVARAAVKGISLQAEELQVKIVEDYGEGIPPLRMEESDVYQLFLNLLINALEAMEGGGRLSVRTRCSGDTIVVKVADTGHGIPREIQDRIYDIFFTTKEKGSGLGLSQVYRTVESLGGKISVKSPLSGKRGSEFTITIPIQ